MNPSEVWQPYLYGSSGDTKISPNCPCQNSPSFFGSDDHTSWCMFAGMTVSSVSLSEYPNDVCGGVSVSKIVVICFGPIVFG